MTIETIFAFIAGLFTRPLFELNILEIALLAGICFLAVLLVRLICIGVVKIFSLFTVVFSAKEKCKKIQCTSCGRTLDRCVCQKNKDKSYVARLCNHRKEEKQKKEK